MAVCRKWLFSRFTGYVSTVVCSSSVYFLPVFKNDSRRKHTGSVSPGNRDNGFIVLPHSAFWIAFMNIYTVC